MSERDASTRAQRGRRILPVALVTALLAVTCAPDVALADGILFESYVGTRPAEADRIAMLVHAVFDRRGFIVDLPTLTRLFHEHAFRQGVVAPRFGEILRKQSLAGANDFSDGNFRRAADGLGKLITAMRQNALVVARDPKNRELALRALVYYALACGRLAEAQEAAPTEAERYARLRDDTMTEVIRSFPSKIITAKSFGEESELLFQRIRDQLNKAGRGKLSIAVSDPDAVIYINEIVQGTAKVEVGDLLPGVYRVLLQMSTGEARQYEVEVTANQVARLAVDWDVDSLFVVGDWVGFKYPTEKEHAREAQLVSELAKKHSNAYVAATVTIARVRGRAAVTGTSYSVISGKLLRSGRVELTGTISDERALDHLVDYLMVHAAVEGVTPVDHPEYIAPTTLEPEHVAAPVEPAPAPPVVETAVTSPPPAPAPRRSHTWPMWAAAGGAVTAFAIGGYALYRYYGPCGRQEDLCRTYVPYAGAEGYAALGAGVALSALSAYWFIRTTNAPNTTRVTMAPLRNGAVVGCAGSF